MIRKYAEADELSDPLLSAQHSFFIPPENKLEFLARPNLFLFSVIIDRSKRHIGFWTPNASEFLSAIFI